MNLGLMPVTGLPLPFLSYGGSSMLVSWLAIGLVDATPTACGAPLSKDNTPFAPAPVAPFAHHAPR